ncbi:MAG: thiamine pyrophosphate-dependent dehydrogenase E1 component subunit alpha [Acidobacteriota bacterium]
MKTVETPTWKFKPLDPSLDRTEIDPRGRHYSREQLTRFYRAMRLARTFETRLGSLYRQGRIVGAVYLGTGQEAIATGVVSRMTRDDIFSTVSRNLAGWFYRGVEPKHVLARWLGRDLPPSYGRELGLFLADLTNFGIAPYHNGSMASWIPSGAGFALAFKMRREPRVYVAFTGDGATSPGDFYEGINLASIHNLPLVVIVENNQFAYSTGNEKEMPVENVAHRAPAFNIPAEIAFGNDIFAVIEVAQRALEHARSGRGPYLVEFKTFRGRGHGEHDDAAYVPREMREYWEARDPIRLYMNYLLGNGGFRQEELAQIDAHCRAVVDEAVDYAERLPLPKPESVTERLFAPR